MDSHSSSRSIRPSPGVAPAHQVGMVRTASGLRKEGSGEESSGAGFRGGFPLGNGARRGRGENRWRCWGMKKWLVLFLAAMLVATLAVSLTGCGGEKDLERAKALMKEGDIKYDEVETTGRTLEDKQAEIAKALLSGDTASLPPEQLENAKNEIEDAISKMSSDLQAAKASYEQILELEGVEKYKEYAGKMLEVIDKNQELLDHVEALMGEFVQMLAAGTTPDLSVLMESEEMQKINELTEEIDALMDEARKLKKDLK